MNQQPPIDPDIQAMKRANRAPLFTALAVVAAIVVVSGLWVLRSYAATRSELVAQGYSNVMVAVKGPFTFAFTGTKGTAACAGTMTRYPGSSAIEESCFDASPTVPPSAGTPTLGNRQQLEASLKRTYAKLGFERFTCPEVANSDAKTTCTLAAENGHSVTVTVERTKIDSDGSWATWTNALDASVAKGEELSEEMTKSVSDALTAKGAHHTGLAVDCGTGVVVFVDDKLTCPLTSKDPKPLSATVLVTKNKDGGYTWKVSGL